MNLHEEHYIRNLYPFQDGILKLVNDAKTPFYLTGGTALSRFYFNHRYSDDLDFFVNQHDDFGLWVEKLFQLLDEGSREFDFEIDRNQGRRAKDFAQLFLQRGSDTVLKLDIVNDIAPHFGGFMHHAILGRIDSLRNILSNKISALGRLEIKDFVDVWSIARRLEFDWKEIFNEAQQKDAGVDPLLVYELFRTIPMNMLALVRWTGAVDYTSFKNDIEIIAEDILRGSMNSQVM
jgi:hypothetical protein